MTAGYGLAGKRVELLKDMVVALSRVAVLFNPNNPPHVPYLRETERTATALGLELREFEVRGPLNLPVVFTAVADWRAEGLLSLPDGMLFSQRERIVELALKNKLPGVYPEAEFATAGGLASYGPSLPELFRQAASYVDKILKGAKPADLPIEQPSKFELVVKSQDCADTRAFDKS
jgi:putative tryptophan/tyrosine transport system substrate-binding protein